MSRSTGSGSQKGSGARPWSRPVAVTNTMLVKERRRDISVADGSRFLQIVDALQIDIVGEPGQRSLEALANFARPHQLTSYDALYLELAISLGLPLCTLDRNLQSAARRCGVDLIIDFERDGKTDS
ncbi:MAG: type II toxin-antitoxin system VapC family toxin [Planctomycetota bacterium]